MRRNVRIRQRRTSVKMEPEMWSALDQVCRETGRSLHEICSEVHDGGGDRNFTSMLRVFLLRYFRDRANRLGGRFAEPEHC